MYESHFPKDDGRAEEEQETVKMALAGEWGMSLHHALADMSKAQQQGQEHKKELSMRPLVTRARASREG
eukprot:414334-Pelagomonas_calceolata.AAC.2